MTLFEMEEYHKTSKFAVWSQRSRLFVLKAWTTLALGPQLNVCIGPFKQELDGQVAFSSKGTMQAAVTVQESNKGVCFVHFSGYQLMLYKLVWLDKAAVRSKIWILYVNSEQGP